MLLPWFSVCKTPNVYIKRYIILKFSISYFLSQRIHCLSCYVCFIDFNLKKHSESNSRKPCCRHFYQISRGLVFASKPSYFLFSRGRTNQRIESDRNKICSLDKPYSLLKFETRLEIELSVEKVA